ncbi:MAG: hypothetical protein M3Q10_19300 [Chloroflexota bacterium]|nr:hypothetical protein [Chloroflexota bacterium]
MTVVVVLAALAVAIVPVSVAYSHWLARNVAPRLAFLPTRLAIAVLGAWVALPWVALAAVAWVVGR